MLNREPREVWQEAFDEALEGGETEFAASRAGDEAVADYLARGADDAYDHWRDRQIMEAE